MLSAAQSELFFAGLDPHEIDDFSMTTGHAHSKLDAHCCLEVPLLQHTDHIAGTRLPCHRLPTIGSCA